MAITGCKNNDDDDDDAYNLTIKIQSNKYNIHDMIVMIMIDIDLTEQQQQQQQNPKYTPDANSILHLSSYII
ncbi:hypothetical protein DERP_001162 [Dermatophagoides pteronyssinus]|uniref:Uncharacterized protein n=1 Tax=Dermatophagoides pteronyssinus TaxID=6956 RepID=A0ABQ8JEF5_DERPT|nr:hypothetical protein DERP_001162 [Dermatophagoides pteronyssinus]